jgi:hypothetical protein
VRGDEFEPFVEIEPAHERMLPTVDAQVALFCLGEKGEGAFTCFSKLSQQFFFVADRSGFQRGWRFQAYEANLCKPHRQMGALPERNVARRFLHDMIGVGENSALDADKVRHNFSGAPLFRPSAFGPVRGRNLIGGAQECGLRTIKLRENGREVQRNLAVPDL